MSIKFTTPLLLLTMTLLLWVVSFDGKHCMYFHLESFYVAEYWQVIEEVGITLSFNFILLIYVASM